METHTFPEPIEFADFLKVGIYVGTIVGAKPNIKALKPAYVLEIDFGELGYKTSSAQLTQNYEIDNLIGKKIVAVLNFPAKKVAGVKSECLVLAAVCPENGTVLIEPSKEVKNGVRIF